MKKIAKFEKISKEQFYKDWDFDDYSADIAYKDIKKPKRATIGSAGYDFYSTDDITLEPRDSAKIATGIRVKIEEGWTLKIYPRSGLGFKYRLQLDNTVGIIDSDYYYSDNEGHIFIKITNDSDDRVLHIKKGEAFAQGIFVEYGITVDDDADGIRNGGFGSTSNNDGGEI